MGGRGGSGERVKEDAMEGIEGVWQVRRGAQEQDGDRGVEKPYTSPPAWFVDREDGGGGREGGR